MLKRVLQGFLAYVLANLAMFVACFAIYREAAYILRFIGVVNIVVVLLAVALCLFAEAFIDLS